MTQKRLSPRSALVNACLAGLFIPCPADLNDDGVVDVSDLLVLLGAWGACPEGIALRSSQVLPDASFSNGLLARDVK